MANELFQRSNPMHQCPKCSKQSLVQMDVDKYHCIWCDFKRNLSAVEPEPESEAGLGPISVLLGGIALVVRLLLL